MVHCKDWYTDSAGTATHMVLHMENSALHISFYTCCEHNGSDSQADREDILQYKAADTCGSRPRSACMGCYMAYEIFLQSRYDRNLSMHDHTPV